MRRFCRSAAGIALVLLVGCGSARQPPRSLPAAGRPRQGDDRALAQALVLQGADVPRGWAQTPPIPTLRCAGAKPFERATATASSRRLSSGYATVQEQVAVYASVRDASHAFAVLASRRAQSCFQAAVRAQIRAHVGGPVTHLETISTERPRGKSLATRWAAAVETRVGRADAYIDDVLAQAERRVSALVVVSGLSPLDERVYDAFVRRAAQRLRAGRG